MQQVNEYNESYVKMIDLFGKRVNLRFGGADYYKTYCGSVATVILFISILSIATLSTIDVLQGKINSLNYMIRNTATSKPKDPIRNLKDYSSDEAPRLFTRKDFTIKDEVFGFALENNTLLDPSYLKFEAGIHKRGQPFNKSVEVYRCDQMVYPKLSNRFQQEVPKNLSIYCFNVSSTMLDKGLMPTVFFRECLNETAGCKPLSVRDRSLREFYVWAFALADESDFTLPKTVLDTNFTASLISVSNWYYKRSTVILREVDIVIRSGIIGRKRTKQTNMFLRNDMDIVSINKDEEIMLELRLKHDRVSRVIITKNFKTLSDLVAFLGGFSKGVTILLLIIVLPVREISYYRKLINHMFSVCHNEEQITAAIKIFGNHYDDEEESQSLAEGACEAPRDGTSPINQQRKKNKEKGTVLKRGDSKNGRRKGGFYNRLADINKMKKRLNSKMKSDKNIGILGEIMEQERITKESFMKNMMKALTPGEDGRKESGARPVKAGGKSSAAKDQQRKSTISFVDLLQAGLGKHRKKRKSRILKTISDTEHIESSNKICRSSQTSNPRDNFRNGKMRDLNVYELHTLSSNVIKAGIKRWMTRGKNNFKLIAKAGDLAKKGRIRVEMDKRKIREFKTFKKSFNRRFNSRKSDFIVLAVQRLLPKSPKTPRTPMSVIKESPSPSPGGVEKGPRLTQNDTLRCMKGDTKSSLSIDEIDEKDLPLNSPNRNRELASKENIDPAKHASNSAVHVLKGSPGRISFSSLPVEKDIIKEALKKSKFSGGGCKGEQIKLEYPDIADLVDKNSSSSDHKKNDYFLKYTKGKSFKKTKEEFDGLKTIPSHLKKQFKMSNTIGVGGEEKKPKRGRKRKKGLEKKNLSLGCQPEARNKMVFGSKALEHKINYSKFNDESVVSERENSSSRSEDSYGIYSGSEDEQESSKTHTERSSQVSSSSSSSGKGEEVLKRLMLRKLQNRGRRGSRPVGLLDGLLELKSPKKSYFGKSKNPSLAGGGDGGPPPIKISKFGISNGQKKKKDPIPKITISVKNGQSPGKIQAGLAEMNKNRNYLFPEEPSSTRKELLNIPSITPNSFSNLSSLGGSEQQQRKPSDKSQQSMKQGSSKTPTFRRTGTKKRDSLVYLKRLKSSKKSGESLAAFKKGLEKRSTVVLIQQGKDVAKAKESEESKRKRQLLSMQKKTEEMFKRSHDLKFHLSCFDYMRLFLPPFMDGGYTKRQLFLKVKMKKITFFALFQLLLISIIE